VREEREAPPRIVVPAAHDFIGNAPQEGPHVHELVVGRAPPVVTQSDVIRLAPEEFADAFVFLYDRGKLAGSDDGTAADVFAAFGHRDLAQLPAQRGGEIEPQFVEARVGIRRSLNVRCGASQQPRTHAAGKQHDGWQMRIVGGGECLGAELQLLLAQFVHYAGIAHGPARPPLCWR
jgi:hypothetical protein